MQTQISWRLERLMRYARMGLSSAQIEKGRLTPERSYVPRHPPFVIRVGDRTPDSVLCPPSLSAPRRRPLLVWRVLPAIAVAAAMRASAVVQTLSARRQLPPCSPPHAPCSPSASAVA